MSAAPQTVAGLVRWARHHFREAGLDDPATDATTLLCGLLGKNRAELLLSGEEPVGDEVVHRVHSAIERRMSREPVHRILGSRAFYGIDLTLSPDTLEPRPDTETLIDMLLPHLRAMAAAKGRVRLIDLGTGTGAIGLSLLHEVAEAEATLTDLSPGALATAGENAARLGLAARVTPLLSRWFDAVDGRFDIIVSNPPYILANVIDSLAPEVRLFDPKLALDGGPDGLDAYRAIAGHADAYLEADGLIAVEIGYDQKRQVETLFAEAGFRLIEARSDFGGNDRALLFSR
ncbi:peptide chain release factor N(5)-glutamine methyltransferase [Rhizobium halophytocola]|uniref:Release factor glutamine methyltransferase n=1 Tax=Rhizobium halophytocola TaxID=735519 RepID=A0ABS4E290_9HYPH|nr:peptide chain release factor N(5)-glutamine methyltransferase [Rhizobium halophytocola]MBP1852052.1 release factor glutamine methyltransferase [Rhizobium halophytocola]